MNKYKYSSIKNFGPNKLSLDQHPLTYCLIDGPDQMFMHGSQSYSLNSQSQECKRYMADYCSVKWDGFCEEAIKKTDKYLPASDFTTGQMLLRDTAERKYLVNMYNGRKVYQPFNPVDYSSPTISYWASGVPEYEVNPDEIDTDPLMNKILRNPACCLNLLLNIYNTMKRKGSISRLQNTNLGRYYLSQGLSLDA